MRRITAIEPQKKRDRVNIHLDGQFAFGLNRLVAAWLRTGQDLSDEKIAQLQFEDARERAYQQAMLFLSYRARSESEIRRNLHKHEFTEETIENVLERLRADGLANDSEFARIWVENRNAFRPRGRHALEMELRSKGLDEETIRSAVSDVNEEVLAFASASKRAARLKDLEWNEFRRKLSEYLARRGFPYGTITPVVTRVWNEMHADGKNFEDEDMT